MRLRFTRGEIRDLLVAWLALGVAFLIFIERDLVRTLQQSPGSIDVTAVLIAFAISLGTAGVGFLLHELAHKVVAVRFGQVAGFRADYGMLLLAVLGAAVGFLFAAPGAVYHRGRITPRERGLVALAGPVTNAVLAVIFFGVILVANRVADPLLALIGVRGLLINLLLAGFNMIPFGPLDGATVLEWNKPVFAVAFLLTAGPAAALFFGFVP